MLKKALNQNETKDFTDQKSDLVEKLNNMEFSLISGRKTEKEVMSEMRDISNKYFQERTILKNQDYAVDVVLTC